MPVSSLGRINLVLWAFIAPGSSVEPRACSGCVRQKPNIHAVQPLPLVILNEASQYVGKIRINRLWEALIVCLVNGRDFLLFTTPFKRFTFWFKSNKHT